MKTILTEAILGLTAFAGAAGAEANDGTRREPEPERGHELRQHAPRRDHRRATAPRYERVYVGRDGCGRTEYRLVRLPEPHRFCDGAEPHSRRTTRREFLFARRPAALHHHFVCAINHADD